MQRQIKDLVTVHNPTFTPVKAYKSWKDNAELIADVARLGYIHVDDTVLDCTYGLGNFWTKWKPKTLIGTDMNPAKAKDMEADFTNLPFADQTFDIVVYDPDFRLNGTPDRGDFDERYGTDVKKTWQDRHKQILDGAAESARVAKKRVLCKTMDQVCSGAVRWLTDDITAIMSAAGYRKEDRFDMISGVRAQPKGRKQVHSRRNASQLLVFKRI